MNTAIDLLGDTIRAARMKKGYTQEAFAEMLDITPVHLANIEGSRRKPSVPLLFQMMPWCFLKTMERQCSIWMDSMIVR